MKNYIQWLFLGHFFELQVCSENPPFLHFGYQKTDRLRPEEWSKVYPKCGGMEQSPINLMTSKRVIKRHSFNVSRLSKFPDKIEIVNTAHTVMMKFHSSEGFTISGGMLCEPYTLQEAHLHWGPNNSVGSEHAKNCLKYPMEMHLVFYKSSAYCAENAMALKDGIAVFAVWYELSYVDNFNLEHVISMIDYIERPFTDVELRSTFSPLKLFPENLHSFYTYHGSLTMPPCYEGVLWFVFIDTCEISFYQLLKLRRMRGEWGYMDSNYRPLQPLNGRQVTLVAPEKCTLAPFERRRKRRRGSHAKGDRGISVNTNHVKPSA